MKFFLNLFAMVNVAYANLGFAGRHRGDHSVHHGNHSFHDHFAHALSVMKYYRQQRGRDPDFCMQHAYSQSRRWKCNIKLNISEIKVKLNECLSRLHMREELCLQALFDDDYFWLK